MENTSIHPSAELESGVSIGNGTRIWQLAHIREGSVIGEMVSIGRGVFIDTGVSVGNKSKIQNYSQIFSPAEIEEEVFVGPGVILTNDKFPRATNPNGSQKSAKDWNKVGVVVKRGASLGAGSICVAPIEIGEWSMVAAGSVVTRNVLPYSLVAGNPAKFIKWIGKSGENLSEIGNRRFLSTLTNDQYELLQDGRLVKL